MCLPLQVANSQKRSTDKAHEEGGADAVRARFKRFISPRQPGGGRSRVRSIPAPGVLARQGLLRRGAFSYFSVFFGIC